LQVPLSWIKQYVDVELSPTALAHALTMAGLESANLGSSIPDYPGVITARIEKIERHPDADKLTVCQVRPADDADPLTIVCGAPNIKEGDVVPLALTGAELPEGKLKKTKIRGVTSSGMMCSQRELKVSDDHSGIWILPPGTPLGKTLPEALGQDDVILECEPTPNRGDLLSVFNIAREIAAVTGKKARPPRFEVIETGPPISELTRVDIEDYAGCPRYVARLCRGVKIGPSPEWMVRRLEACGLRSISNVVDVTNFVMLELGQPLHAFDFNRLREKRIVVKRARAGDKFTTLDGQERMLRDDTLMICDGAGPVAIAGVMGGRDSEVSDDTVDVLIESAYFKPTVIRHTARLLGIPTEASRRFDKGVDPLGTELAADRAAALIKELAGGEIAKGVVDARDALFRKKRITLRPERVSRIIGIALPASQQRELLERLDGMTVRETDGRLEAEAPSYRPDLLEEHDLIEEIARLVGYDRVPASLPAFRMDVMKRQRDLELGRRLTERLSAQGFAQVVLTNFEDPKRLEALGLEADDYRLKAVKLANPLSENESLLRTTLVPKLVSCLALNRSRGATGEVRIYELGAAFEDQGAELPRQRGMIAGLISPATEKTLWKTGCLEDGFYDVKAVAENLLGALRFPGARIEAAADADPYFHPGKCAKVMIGAAAAGQVGQLHPRTARALDVKGDVFLFELSFDMLAERADYVPKAEPVSKFPPTLRDIAVVVDEGVAMEDIIRAARKVKIKDARIALHLFDVFRGGSIAAGKKSMAFHVSYQSLQRTLTDEEVNVGHGSLADQLQRSLGAALR